MLHRHTKVVWEAHGSGGQIGGREKDEGRIGNFSEQNARGAIFGLPEFV